MPTPRDAAIAAVLEFKARGEFGKVLGSFTYEQAELLVENLACHVEELVIAELRRKGVIPE